MRSWRGLRGFRQVEFSEEGLELGFVESALFSFVIETNTTGDFGFDPGDVFHLQRDERIKCGIGRELLAKGPQFFERQIGRDLADVLEVSKIFAGEDQ